MRGHGRRLLLLAAALGAVGCVREIVPHAYDGLPTLMVARSSGTVLLQWDSRPGDEYSVVYSASQDRRAEWKPLPGAQRIPGTGRSLQVTDRPPPGVSRHYRLRLDRSGEKR